MAITVKVRFWWEGLSPEEAFDACTINDPTGLQVDTGSGLRVPHNGADLWTIDTALTDRGYARGHPTEVSHVSGSVDGPWKALYEFKYRVAVHTR